MAESVPLLATVGAFQGWDALFQFAPSSPGWETQMSGLQVTPGHYALYPIAAMIFRRMDVRAGDVVFERLRDPGYQFSFARDERGAAPEVLAVGRVHNRYVERRTPDVLRQDLVEKLWDKQAGVCRAGTGEFDWHYKDGWLRLNAERTQGAFGALGGRRIECPDVKIETPNPHCAVIVTAMEKKPIPEAGRLLVAAVGRAMNMKAGPASGTQVPPCMMEPVKGTVSVKTPLRKVYAVTAVGYRAGEVKAERKGGWLTFRMEGAPQVLYYEITK